MCLSFDTAPLSFIVATDFLVSVLSLSIFHYSSYIFSISSL